MKKTRQHLLNNIIMLAVFLGIVSYAFSTGTTGHTQLTSNSGCNCHSASASQTVSVVISGPDNLAPNQTAEYLVTVTGGPLAAAGVNIAASAGILIPGPGLRLENMELTHSSPMMSSAGTVIFTFSYTAPAEGTATIYATANSVNNTGSATGDMWNFSQPKSILVNPAVNVEDEMFVYSFKIEQNYPNPFNPSTSIYYEIPADISGEKVILKIYDIMGTEVAELVNEVKTAGAHRIDFNAAKLPSGIYIYKITAGKYSASRKMSLIK
jgi:hypothetical protein